jgi:hypothetical protein
LPYRRLRYDSSEGSLTTREGRDSGFGRPEGTWCSWAKVEGSGLNGIGSHAQKPKSRKTSLRPSFVNILECGSAVNLGSNRSAGASSVSTAAALFPSR